MSKKTGFAGMNLPTKKYELFGSMIELNAISFNDLTKLISEHKDQLIALFDGDKLSGTDKDMHDMLTDALLESPEVMASIIARSSGEEGSEELIVKLPFPTQIEMLEIIADLTLNQVGGLGKFLPTVIRIFQKVTGAVTSLKA